MIETRTGNMLEEVTEGYMMQGCNAQGRMGSGIALAIKNKWPVVFDHYNDRYKRGHSVELVPNSSTSLFIPELEMGTIIPVQVASSIAMINAITQRFYTGHAGSTGGREVDYEAVASCCELINDMPLADISVPPILNFPLIGAGLAKGNWNVIASIIDETITNMYKVLWVLP